MPWRAWGTQRPRRAGTARQETLPPAGPGTAAPARSDSLSAGWPSPGPHIEAAWLSGVMPAVALTARGAARAHPGLASASRDSLPEPLQPGNLVSPGLLKTQEAPHLTSNWKSGPPHCSGGVLPRPAQGLPARLPSTGSTRGLCDGTSDQKMGQRISLVPKIIPLLTPLGGIQTVLFTNLEEWTMASWRRPNHAHGAQKQGPPRHTPQGGRRGGGPATPPCIPPAKVASVHR